MKSFKSVRTNSMYVDMSGSMGNPSGMSKMIAVCIHLGDTPQGMSARPCPELKLRREDSMYTQVNMDPHSQVYACMCRD